MHTLTEIVVKLSEHVEEISEFLHGAECKCDLVLGSGLRVYLALGNILPPGIIV